MAYQKYTELTRFTIDFTAIKFYDYLIFKDDWSPTKKNTIKTWKKWEG